jgi:hypothetical protein
MRVANFFIFLLLNLILSPLSYADSISIFAGKSTDSSLAHIPQRFVEDKLEIEKYKSLGLIYQQTVNPPKALPKLNTSLEYILIQHEPSSLVQTALAYRIESPTVHFLSLPIRFGLSEGLSYVHGTANFEEGTAKEPDKKYKFLNYIGAEVAVLDKEEKYSIFFRINHRSGIFGLIAPEHVGSNFITAGFRKYF